MFIWDAKSGRYRDELTKKFVSRSVVLKHVERQNGRSKNYMRQQAQKLVDRSISLGQFQATMIEELKRSHIRMALLAAGGKNGVSEREYGVTGAKLREEYKYLNNFVRAIARGELTPNRIIYRAGLYANSSSATFYESEKISRVRHKKDKILVARRSLDAQSHHCSDCPAYSTNGEWRPVEEVVLPKRNCTCHSRCRCKIEYKYITLSDRLL